MPQTAKKSVVFNTKTLFQPNLHGSLVYILLQYDLRQKKPRMLPNGAKVKQLYKQ